MSDDSKTSSPPTQPTRPMATLRLPKQVDADPRGPALVAGLLESGQILWSGGSILTPTAHLTPELARSLHSAGRAGRLVRGLESASQTLAAEEKGLRIADERMAAAGGDSRGKRVSRLLMLSNDGAERFYRQVESVLRQHAPRVLAVRLDASAAQLSSAALGPETLTRLLLVAHREGVADVLLSLAPQWPTPDSTPGSTPD